MAKSVLDRRLSRRLFWQLWPQWRRRSRVDAAGSFEDLLLGTYDANLKAFLPLAFDIKDQGAAGNHGYTYSGVTFGGPTPSGFKYPICATFDGAASQVRLENTSYPFGMARWTISCWFKKTGAGVATATAGGADGFPATDPIVPLVAKGRGEADGSNVDANWHLGLNKVNNGSTYRLAGDFEDMASGANHRIVGTTNIVDGLWYHGVFTFDGAQMKLFLNGALEATVATSAAPRSDSVQKAGIGTAYTSASVAGGFFAGLLCGVGIWSEALPADAIADLYAKGIAAKRKSVVFTQDDADNHISHGESFVNWSSVAVTHNEDDMVFADGGSAEIIVGALSRLTPYWCSFRVSARSGSCYLRIKTHLADQNLGFLDATMTQQYVNLDTFTLGKRVYLKLYTKSVEELAYRLRLELTNSVPGDTLTLDDFRIYPIPARSAAKVAALGDRCGGFDAPRAASVDTAILHADADSLGVVAIGDTSDATISFATANDTLKNAILGRGGKCVAGMGNHDYDGSNEAGFAAYWNTAGYNNGKGYYSAQLGNLEFFFFDDLNDLVQQPDNGGGYTAVAAALQDSVAGQHVLRKLAESSARWPVFVFHHPAYSSSAAGTGTAHARWNWAGLGVPLVLQGHTHGIERLQKDGITFYTVAMGGGNHHGWGTIDADTKFREENQAVSGYLKLHDGGAELVLEYFDTNQNLLDRVKILRRDV
jgi:hypothetical protein